MNPTAYWFVLKLRIAPGEKDPVASGIYSRRFVVFSFNQWTSCCVFLAFLPVLRVADSNLKILWFSPPNSGLAGDFYLWCLEKIPFFTSDHYLYSNLPFFLQTFVYLIFSISISTSAAIAFIFNS